MPDDLRCRRSDGRSWRCPRRAVSGVSFCEHHYGQAQRHAAQRAAPAEPKEKRGVSALVAVDHPPEKRRKRGGAMDELVRVAVRRQVKRSEERRKRGKTSKEAKGKEVVINLPNGVMAISPTPLKGLGNADPPLDQKLGLGFNGADFSSQRRFRSKNLEPVPIQSISVSLSVHFWLRCDIFFFYLLCAKDNLVLGEFRDFLALKDRERG